MPTGLTARVQSAWSATLQKRGSSFSSMRCLRTARSFSLLRVDRVATTTEIDGALRASLPTPVLVRGSSGPRPPRSCRGLFSPTPFEGLTAANPNLPPPLPMLRRKLANHWNQLPSSASVQRAFRLRRRTLFLCWLRLRPNNTNFPLQVCCVAASLASRGRISGHACPGCGPTPRFPGHRSRKRQRSSPCRRDTRTMSRN
jgi:hypothetical protein